MSLIFEEITAIFKCLKNLNKSHQYLSVWKTCVETSIEKIIPIFPWLENLCWNSWITYMYVASGDSCIIYHIGWVGRQVYCTERLGTLWTAIDQIASYYDAGHALPRGCQLRYVWVTRVWFSWCSWERRMYSYNVVNSVDLCSRISVWSCVRLEDRGLHVEKRVFSAVRGITAIRWKPGYIRTVVRWKPRHF